MAIPHRSVSKPWPSLATRCRFRADEPTIRLVDERLFFCLLCRCETIKEFAGARCSCSTHHQSHITSVRGGGGGDMVVAKSDGGNIKIFPSSGLSVLLARRCVAVGGFFFAHGAFRTQHAVVVDSTSRSVSTSLAHSTRHCFAPYRPCHSKLQSKRFGSSIERIHVV